MSACGGLFRAQILVDEQLGVYDWWRSLAPTASGAPGRNQLRPEEIAAHLPHITLFERAGDDWRIRLAGTALFDALGEEISGRLLGDLPLGEGVRAWRRMLEFSCHTSSPVCGAQRLWWNGPRAMARFWLRLPFAGPTGYPALVMGHDSFRPLQGALRAPAVAWAG